MEKDIVAVDIQRGTDRPYYLAKKKGCGQKASMSGRFILRFLYGYGNPPYD